MDYDGIGAFFYQPPIMVTENKGEQLSKTKSPGYRIRKIVLSHSLKNDTKIVVSDDGFLGIFENDTTYALKIIKTIFATGITWGLSNEYVRKQDLCRFSLIKDGDYIQLNPMGGPSERKKHVFISERR